MAKTERIGGVELGRLRELAAGRYWSEGDGRAALAAFEASGLTRVAFGRETGISPQRLSWWRRRLEVSLEASGKIEFAQGPAKAKAPSQSHAFDRRRETRSRGSG